RPAVDVRVQADHRPPGPPPDPLAGDAVNRRPEPLRGPAHEASHRPAPNPRVRVDHLDGRLEPGAGAEETTCLAIDAEGVVAELVVDDDVNPVAPEDIEVAAQLLGILNRGAIRAGREPGRGSRALALGVELQRRLEVLDRLDPDEDELRV